MTHKVVKFLAVILVSVCISTTGAKSSYAEQLLVGNVPGTNAELFNVQSRRAQNKQLGDKAFRVEIVRKPEAVTDLICLPKLNGNFAGVAALFSDLKDTFSFNFDIANLCSMVFGADTNLLGDELNGLLEVAATGAFGLNLDIGLEACTKPLDIGIDFEFDLGGGFSAGGVNQLDLFGCAIELDVGVEANFDMGGGVGAGVSIPQFCIGLVISPFKCRGIGQLAGDLGLGDGKILPLTGGGVNGGVMYASQDEEISLLAGGSANPSDILANALGVDDINLAVGAMSDLSLTVDFSAEVGASSTDGLSADGGINVDAGAAVMAGSGNDFVGAYSGTDNAQEVMDAAAEDLHEHLDVQPGQEGSIAWNPFPTIGAGASGEVVLDLMGLIDDGEEE